MSIRGRMRAATMVVALGCAVYAGCSQARQVKVQEVARQKYEAGDWDGAVDVMMKGKEGKAFAPADRVAYWLNLGMLLHNAKKYNDSNEVLQKAALRADELYTTSLTTAAGTLFVNETVSDYQGEDFERVLVHVVGALNYAEEGDLENARVEAVKTNEKLKYFRTHAQSEGGSAAFSEDAFADWLTGIIYEMQGDANDALISFKSADQGYRDVYGKYFQMAPPPFLGEDIIRAAEEAGSGFESDIEAAKKEYPDADGKTFEMRKDRGELLVLHACGEAPEKTDFYLNCQQAKVDVDCDYTADETGFVRVSSFRPSKDVRKIALPVFTARPHRIAGVRISADGESADSVPVEPVTQIAEKDLADRMARTFHKSLLRMMAKEVTEKGAQRLGGEGLKELMGLVNNANEEADKRSWTTLPAEFNVARLWLTPGEHDVALVFFDTAGNVVRRGSLHATVAAGKQVMVTVPTVD